MAAIGRYQVLAKIAAGGMAEVYLTRTQGLAGFSKVAAVKRILPHVAQNPEFMQLFVNEANLCLQLSHPNIVETLEFSQDGDSYFLAMEYVDGATLRDLLRAAADKGQRLPMGVALKIISLTLEGLGYAHALRDNAGKLQNVVHRDISPHNVLVARSGAVKVADFGIAKAASVPSLTKTGQVRGKVRYMSPEQINVGPLDSRSDLFAVGITLFEVLTGHRPFAGESEAEAMVSITNEPPTPLSQYLPQVPEGLQAVLDRALAKNPADRYADAGQMQADVEVVLVKLGQSVKGADIAAVVGALCERRADLAAAIADSEPAPLAAPQAIPEPVFPGPTHVDPVVRSAGKLRAAPAATTSEPAATRAEGQLRSNPRIPVVPQTEDVITDRQQAVSRPAQVTDPQDVETARRDAAQRPVRPAPEVDVPATARIPSVVRPSVEPAQQNRTGLWVGGLALLGVGVALAVSAELGRERNPETLDVIAVKPAAKPATELPDAGPKETSIAQAIKDAPDSGPMVVATVSEPPSLPPLPADPTPAMPAPAPESGGGGGKKVWKKLMLPRGNVATVGFEDEDGMAIIPEKPSEWEPRVGTGTIKVHLLGRAAIAVDDTEHGVVHDLNVTVQAGEHLVRVWALNGQNQSYKVLVRRDETKTLNFGF
ncbi:MAG: protein kinase [Deltaproteobacteria bacterium]|nr:protein kinase [Deltaproteobacteria bacterium]